MRCEDISPQLADYLAGSLSVTERDAVKSHVDACATCKQELHGLSETWNLLGQIPAATADTNSMRARVDALIQREQDQLQRAAPRRFQWNPMITGLAASLVLAIGVLLGRGLNPAPAASPEVTALRGELRDLRQMVTLSLMQQQSASERLRGVSFSSRVDGSGEEIVIALLDTLKHDNNVNVRLASIDALRRFAERDVVRQAAVDALATQNSPLVQMALIDFVVENQDREAIGALRRLSENPASDQTVRTRASWGIQNLGVQS